MAKGCITVQTGRRTHDPSSFPIYRKRSGEDDFTTVASIRRSPYHDYVISLAPDYTYSVRYRGTTGRDFSAAVAPKIIVARGDLAA